MPSRPKSAAKKDSTATIGFEAKLWLTADKLRNNMDAAEPSGARQTVRSTSRRVIEANQYKHVVLGLIFLKDISDTFDEHRAKLLAGQGDYAGANAEDPDEYKAENVFWVPADARWSHLHPDLPADYVLANGSMSCNQSGEGRIRQALIKADLVDCMVVLLGQLFCSNQIPVCLWFLPKRQTMMPHAFHPLIQLDEFSSFPAN